MCREARAEATSLGKRCCGRAGRREASRLIDAAQFLRKALRPATCNRGIVVDENKGAVIYRSIVEDRLDQGESLAILITRGIGQFVVGSRELPIEEPEEGSPA